MIILLFAAIVFGLINLSKYQRHIHDLAKTNLEKKTKNKAPKEIKKSKEAKKIKETSTVDEQPTTPPADTVTTQKFDFYNILPQKKTTSIETSYELEVTIAKDFATADRLKAELSLSGFTVSITPVNRQGIQKYSVSVGPYDNKEGAIIDQQKLKQNNISSTLKKIR